MVGTGAGRAPVERKVTGATLGAAVAGVVVWALNAYVFGGDTPEAVEALVALVVPGLAAFAAGWWAKHTYRPLPGDVPPPGPVPPPAAGK